MAIQSKHDPGVASYRCPACGRGQPANLLVDDSPVAVHVADRSRDGFSVVADGRPPIKVGAVVQLRSAAGWHQVRVTEIVKDDPADSEWQGDGAGLFRVELHEIGEYRDPQFAQGRKLGGRVRLFGRAMAPSWLLAVARWIAWGVPILTIPIAFVLLFWYSDVMLARFRQWRAGFAGPPAVQQASAEELLHAAVRLPGADVFAVPEVARELELTEAQQQAILQIQAMTKDAFRQINPSLDGSSRQTEDQVRQKVLDAARQEALQTLTPQQRKRWEALAASAAAPPDQGK